MEFWDTDRWAYMFLLNPAPYLLEDSCYWTPGLLQVPWSYFVPASALDLKKTAFELLSVLNTRNTWESQHWVEFQSLFGHFVQKLCFLWWWLLLLWLFNKGLLTYSNALMCCFTLKGGSKRSIPRWLSSMFYSGSWVSRLQEQGVMGLLNE